MRNPISYRRLSELSTGEEGVITRLFGHGSFRNRITEMGFVRGKMVRVIKNAPLADPIEYEILGYRIALRKSEADLIEVCDPKDLPSTPPHPGQGTFSGESVNRFLHEAGRHINVALVGNPNCGKTSLFNVATGAHEHVGNYSGVTVDAKHATFTQEGYTFELVDLPGTYSITEYTPEELYVRTHILNEMPDVVINVIDASNLERNLYLTTQLIDMNLKVVIALNMYDELESSGVQLDYRALGSMIGIPIVPTVAARQEGVDTLFHTVIDVFEDNEPMVRHIHINYGSDIEQSIRRVQHPIWQDSDLVARYSSRFLAIKLLCDDQQIAKMIASTPHYTAIMTEAEHERQKLERLYGESVDTSISNAKYGFIMGALEETCHGRPTQFKSTGDDRIDRIMTHRLWGLPLFLLLMWAMFQATFTLGAIPAGWMEQGVEWLSAGLQQLISAGPLRDLLVDGIVRGVGGVIVFLPNILILFLFISLMEDTGYMARAAFLMDKVMHKIGLHGKSFIPLLMGFGCNVPAIMATRTLESRKDRILTMLIIPFMSCSARLPVYVLLISIFFPSHRGLVLFSIYLIGIMVAVLSSILFKKLLFARAEAPFVMELPPYRIPTTRNVLRHMWSKGAQYLRKMGTVILGASILIWALGYYPQPSAAERQVAQQQREVLMANESLPMEAREKMVAQWESAQHAFHQEHSYIGQFGHFIEPVLRPLGFDWQIGVSLFCGSAAKEIVVSTMAVLSNSGDSEDSFAQNLRRQVHTQGPRAGEKVYSPLVAYGLMLFILLYLPCIAAVTAIRREAGRKWAIFSVVYSVALAWFLSFALYQIGSLF